MGSSLFYQALYMVPVTNARLIPVKLGFSSSISCQPFSFRPTTIAVSGSPITGGKYCKSGRSFTVRAESGSGEEASNIAVGNEEFSEDSVVAIESVEKPEWKQRIKLGDIMGILNKKAIEASDSQRKTPDIRVGDVVEIKLEVPENRRRLSIYKGIVMSKQNAGIHTTIRIRRIIAGVGVEIVFPVYSPNIKEIRVLSHRKVRRARLYYLRDKLPRLSTFK